jgi:hypothetical protein
VSEVRRWTGLLLIVCASVGAERAEAQVRGVYPTGMSATNSGGTPAPGFTYSNLFIFNSRDQLRGPDGELLSTGNNAVMIDMNTLVWVGRNQILGGARFSAAATLLVSNNSLASDTEGPVSGGGGFGDSYYQPFILGWQTQRADVRIAYGILAPTGRFQPDATDNVGSGYWTHAPSIGATIYLTETRSTAVSAFHLYEVHTTQKGTNIHPGQTANLDYSLTRTVPLHESLDLQVGLIGYEQWQTTDKTGPTITAAQASAHYKVHALGVASNLMLPSRGVSLGWKYLKEFSSTATFQGYTLHISAAIGF